VGIADAGNPRHPCIALVSDDPALTQSARTLIGEMKNVIYVSAASAWEIATKVRLGKLPSAVDLAADFTAFLERERFQILPISAEHAVRAGLLPGTHKDPFDRMLIVQAQAEDMLIVSNEKIFDAYGVRRLW
jgi:PIN domain nuclease of toxin-antitoxin system